MSRGTRRGRGGKPAQAVRHEGGGAAQAFLLRGSVFLAGAAVMITEITASRLLAPVFGNTIFCWTGIIGTILAALAVGYALGGRLADRVPTHAAYYRLLLLSSAAVGSIWFVGPAVLRAIGLRFGVQYGPVVAGILIFVAPSVLLAAVGPFAVRLGSREIGRVGRTSGAISMLSALGSILGTFAAGFWLIPVFGSRSLFPVLALTLAATAIAGIVTTARGGEGRPRGGDVAIGAGAILLALYPLVSGNESLPAGTLRDEESRYHRIRVIEQDLGGVRVRHLLLDSTYEGARFVGRNDLVMDYQKFYRLADHYVPSIDRALFIGGGAYGMPLRLAEDHPGATVDVVEIDPRVQAAGRDFFGLGAGERVNAIVADGRRYLAETDRRYDFIFGDAYNGLQHVPFHLTTREFFRLVRDRLSPRGVFCMNLISAMDGKDGRLFRSILATLRDVFPTVEVYSVNGDYARRNAANLILVGANVEVPHPPPPANWWETVRGEGLSSLLARRVTKPIDVSDDPVLTDEHAPVEYLVARALDLSRAPAPVPVPIDPR